MSINVESPARVPARSPRRRAIDRAIAKAHEQARADNLPTLLRSHRDADGDWRQTWSVGSRTVAGSVYTIDLCHDANGVQTLCDCAAAESDRICWHRAAVRLAHLGQLAYHDAATGRTLYPLTPKEAADLLDCFAPDPADELDWSAFAAG
jgi:hypothetical protein